VTFFLLLFSRGRIPEKIFYKKLDLGSIEVKQKVKKKNNNSLDFQGKLDDFV
jgi:hypothetical protein